MGGLSCHSDTESHVGPLDGMLDTRIADITGWHKSAERLGNVIKIFFFIATM